MPESQKIKNRSSDVVTETSEVFSSLQGEGPHLGKRQIFVRFGRCNMHCIYCDEVEKMQVGSYQDISLSTLLRRVEELERFEPGHHSVSLTGGEPLFYPRFLKVFLPELKRRGFKFAGSTICYAFMQAVGMVNDHVTDCFRYESVKKAL